MGGMHSRSEDLYKKSIINSETFIGSITETPGYFSRTVHTLDFLDSKFPNPARTEMSYNGPPSHLQNSIDVHPFWSEFGREFQPTDRYNDMSNSDVPRGLVPGTDTAQEMRNLEQKESLQDLRSQVKAKMAQVRPIPEEEREELAQPESVVAPDEIDSANIPPLPPSKPVQTKPSESKRAESIKAKHSPSKVADNLADKDGGSFQAEQAALELLDSVIMESMNLEDDDDDKEEITSPPVIEDSNWSLGTESYMKAELRRRNLNKPVPGVMHDAGNRNSYLKSETDLSSNGGQNVLRTSMYLPDANFMNPHSAAAKSNQNTSLMAYRIETADHRNTLEHRPRPKSTLGFPMERTLSNGLSSTSIDTGVFSDSGTTNSASSNDSGIGSGGGVRDLVKSYNEQTRASTLEPSWKRHSANLDDYGRSRGALALERSVSPTDDTLPLDDNLRVPQNSAILDEIRKELQLNA